VLRQWTRRSTARHDELMVRLEERPWRGGMTVLLDRRDVAHRGRGADSSLEFAVSLTASICTHLLARGEPLDLLTEDGVELSGRGSGISPEPLLDALAALRPSARPDLAGPELRSGTDVLAVLGALEPGEVETLLGRRTGGGNAVLLDTSTWDPSVRDRTGSGGTAAANAATLRGAGWHVTIASAGSSPERVWSDLVSGL
jgi:uncharacterized protein (DUF58 family)